jgi:hypothetical protein
MDKLNLIKIKTYVPRDTIKKVKEQVMENNIWEEIFANRMSDKSKVLKFNNKK